MPNEIFSINAPGFEPAGEVHPSPIDWRDQFIYFLMVDRFHNNRDDIPPYDPSISPQGRNHDDGEIFQGGNLKGIIAKLDYLKNLGCSAIWLSPIFKNRQEDQGSYHGYGIQNFLEVDPRLGTEADLRELVDKAHVLGMYIILDIILNHTGNNWMYTGDYTYFFRKHPPTPFDFGGWRGSDPSEPQLPNDGVWPEQYQHPDYYKRRGQITDWDDRDQALNGDFYSLKELDIRKAEVLDALIRSYKYWIASADIDGFRVDTVKHMEDSQTAIFCNAVREYAHRIGKHNFFIFGEVATTDDKMLHSYIGRNSRIPGTNERFPSLDSCLDFPLNDVLGGVIKGFNSVYDLIDRYEKFKTLYSDHGESGQYFVTFLDNHDDHHRFMYNNPNPKQAIQAIGYLLTSQGVPCIYYGTEQGFNGGGDSVRYVRECMFGGSWGAFDTTGVHFFNDNHTIYQGIGSIAKVRAKEPALRYGRQYFREISTDGFGFGYPIKGNCTLAFSRILDSDEIVVALNLDANPRQDHITVDGNLTPPGSGMVDLISGADDFSVQELHGRSCLQMPLDGHQIAIMKRR
jgi:glycosidase